MSKTSYSFHYRLSLRWGDNCTGKLYIRVIRHRGSITIVTEYCIYPHEWDEAGHCLIFPEDANDPRYRALTEIAAAMAADLERVESIVANLEASGEEFSAADVRTRFTASAHCGDTMWGYATQVAEHLDANGLHGTAEAYRCAARSLRRFNGGQDVPLVCIDATLIRAFQAYLMRQGHSPGSSHERRLKPNSIATYLRNIRALYNRAIHDRLIPAREANPFEGCHTGVYETEKRAADEDELHDFARLEDLLGMRKKKAEKKEKQERRKAEKQERKQGKEKGKEKEKEKEQGKGGKTEAAGTAGTAKTAENSLSVDKINQLLTAHALFMFCFYARGMSFADLAHLRKCDVQGDRIYYTRRKTGRQMKATLIPEMKLIIKMLEPLTENSPYLFPILDAQATGIEARRIYQTAHKRQNALLKELSELAGLTRAFTTHVARHTWATLAKRMNYPTAMICEGLGHRDIRTTEIYLNSFANSAMDQLSIHVAAAAKPK